MSRYLRPIVERGKKTRAGSASEIIWLRWLGRAPTQPRIDLAVHQATEPPIRPLEKRWKNKD
jgi:hypothetical protein